MSARPIPIPDEYNKDTYLLEGILNSLSTIKSYSFPNIDINTCVINNPPMYNEGEEVLGYREIDNLFCVFNNSEDAAMSTLVDEDYLVSNLYNYNKCEYEDWIFYTKFSISEYLC